MSQPNVERKPKSGHYDGGVVVGGGSRELRSDGPRGNATTSKYDSEELWLRRKSIHFVASMGTM